MSRCVVCGIDSPRAARRIVSLAASLARDLDSRVLLAHVVELPGSFPYGLRPPPARQALRLRRRLGTLAAQHDLPPGSDVRVEVGEPARQLLEIAEEEDAELIVVGSRGMGPARAAILGGVSSALMRRAPCPVLVDPPRPAHPADARGVQSIVCGLAGGEPDQRVLRFAGDLARRADAYLHVVRGYDPHALQAAAAASPRPPLDSELHEAGKRHLDHAVKQVGVRARTHLRGMPPDEAIEQLAEQTRADLVVVGSQRRGALSSILTGSLPVRLVAGGETPVVTLPRDAELDPGSGHYELAKSA